MHEAEQLESAGAAGVEPAMDPVVFEHVTMRFHGPPVLEDVSFRLSPGETRILLGPAGVGKSVLLKLAIGLLRPTEGRISLFGEEITGMSEEHLLKLRIRTGMVFQEGALFDSLTVRDNVGYQLIEQQVPDEVIDRRVKRALEFVELGHTFSMLPASLSGGMRRRVAIARAILAKPELLLYDSPTGGLDPVTSHTINELIVKERDVYRTPSILVTHRLQDAFTMATNVFNESTNQMEPLGKGKTHGQTTFLVLKDGRLVFDGSIAELIHSEDPFLQSFLA
jgi:phospholipid/cholesterol/gamma-HCH transport system ATP-binding protein